MQSSLLVALPRLCPLQPLQVLHAALVHLPLLLHCVQLAYVLGLLLVPVSHLSFSANRLFLHQRHHRLVILVVLLCWLFSDSLKSKVQFWNLWKLSNLVGVGRLRTLSSPSPDFLGLAGELLELFGSNKFELNEFFFKKLYEFRVLQILL